MGLNPAPGEPNWAEINLCVKTGIGGSHVEKQANTGNNQFWPGYQVNY
jgi:hypothetical protein